MIALSKPFWLRVFFYPSTGKSELMRSAIGFEVCGPMPDPVPLTLANVLLLCEHEERVKRYKASVGDLKPIWERPMPRAVTHVCTQQGLEWLHSASGQLGES